MNKTISDRTNLVEQKINTIENELIEIGNLLTVVAASQNNKTTPKKSPKCKSLSELITLAPKIKDLKEFYSNQLYSSIRQSVLNSLKCLAQLCGFQINETSQIDNTNNNAKIEQDEQINYIRLKTDDDLMIRRRSSQSSSNENAEDRAVSVSSVLSKTQWIEGRKFEQSYLQ